MTNLVVETIQQFLGVKMEPNIRLKTFAAIRAMANVAAPVAANSQEVRPNVALVRFRIQMCSARQPAILLALSRSKGRNLKLDG